ncbi:hypothetical protein HC891_17465 [Candidatus Gracilibacteria bacterium]|nr:hypothetical protein [Candidatus Gracilibacteria bacterium]
MTNRSDFSAQEWNAITELPLLIGTAVIITPQAGPVQFVQETLAMMKFIDDSKEHAGALVAAVAQTIDASAQERADTANSAVGGATIHGEGESVSHTVAHAGAELRQQLLEKIAAVNTILAAKASADDAAAYKRWLVHIAQNVAQAAKEGTFLGLGGQRVTEAESMVIGEIAQALGVEHV